MKPRHIWPEGQPARRSQFGEVFRTALSSFRRHEVHDKYGLYVRRLHGDTRVMARESFATRRLPVSGLSGIEFLRLYDPAEWKRVSQSLAPPGVLTVWVLAYERHPLGDMVTLGEERELFRQVGVDFPPTANSEES